MEFVDQAGNTLQRRTKVDTTLLPSKRSSLKTVEMRDTGSATFSPKKKGKSLAQVVDKDKKEKEVPSNPEDKRNSISPFHIVNNFYIDQLEKQKAERQKLERETRNRVERDKKKRLEILAKLKQSGKAAEEMLKSKQWTTMGGLGPNIGTEQWLQKTEKYNKMLRFSRQIKKMNFEKVKCVPFMSNSRLYGSQRNDPRSLGIEYSRNIPLPKVILGKRVLEEISHSQSKEQITEIERLELKHNRFKEMMNLM